jgi:hypothetical protein
MQILQRIRNNPIIILCAVATLLAIWITKDLLTPRAQLNNQALLNAPPPPADPQTMKAQILDRRNSGTSTQPGPVSMGLLPKLKPGMSRIEVEQLLGPPASEQLEPVVQINGRLTYCTSYELADLETPMTIRPIQPKRSSSVDRSPESKSHVSLEYDASKKGHPLIDIHYLDPLF